MRVFEQQISREELARWQLARLNGQLRVMSASRFYAGLAGVRLRRLEELSRLPFTTADDLRQRGEDLLCLPASQVQRIISLRSSGTAGPWKRLHFSAADLEQTAAFFAVGMGYLCGPGDRVLIFMPGQTPNGVGQLLARGLLRLGAKPLIYGPISDYAEAAAVLTRERPHTLVGLPGQLRRLALTAPQAAPQRVLLSADRVSPAVRETLARVWGCEVFEHYGLTESGLGCAVECPAHRGLHLRHDALYAEIIDPLSCTVLPEGQWGELVLTTLTREAQPLLRYRSGDAARLLAAPCGCGSPLPRLEVAGRLSELQRPYSIYRLDDVLLADDAIWDYTAELADGCLHLAVAGDVERARRLAAALWPELAVTATPGPGFVSCGTLKRRLGP